MGRFSGARCILFAIASKKRKVLMEWRLRTSGGVYDQRRGRRKKAGRMYGTDWGRLLMFKLEVAKLAAAVGPVTGKEDTPLPNRLISAKPFIFKPICSLNLIKI